MYMSEEELEEYWLVEDDNGEVHIWESGTEGDFIVWYLVPGHNSAGKIQSSLLQTAGEITQICVPTT